MVIPLSNLKTLHKPECNKCGSSLTKRIPRGSEVKIFLFWLPIKRYKCYKCNKKKYVLGNRTEKK